MFNATENSKVKFDQSTELNSSEAWFHWVLKIVAISNLWLAKADHLATWQEKPAFEANPKFRGLTTIIQEGATEFQRLNPNVELKFSKLDGYLTLEKFLAILDEPFSEEQIEKIPYNDDFRRLFLGKNLKEAFAIIFKLNLKNQNPAGDNFIQLVRILISTKLPLEVNDKIAGAANYTNPEFKRFGLKNVDDLNIEIYQELIQVYETKATEKQEPQSLSVAITFLLDKYHGDFNQTWNMLANFCKYITRDKDRMAQAGKWMQLHILDEFSPHQGYQDLNPNIKYKGSIMGSISKLLNGIVHRVSKDAEFWADTSLINQIGKVYHAAFLLSMLEVMDARVLALLTAAEYAAYGIDHGPNKAMVDALLLQNLLFLEKTLLNLVHQTTH